MAKIKHALRISLVPALWCVGIGLLANALVLAWSRPGSNESSFPIGNVIRAATLMPRQPGAGRGETLIPLQLGEHDWGLALLNKPRHVFAIYRILPSASRIRLMAVRDYRYDLRLKDFNNASPTPAQVRQMTIPPATAR